MPDPVGQFAKAKYLNLETFRKTGVGVRTPVWFAQDPSWSTDAARPLVTFYVYTLPDSGKAKRIRNNPKVRIAPCTIGGKLRGAWVDARARICTGAEADKGQGLLNEKYGLSKRIGDWYSRLRGRTQIVLAVEID